MGFRGKSWLPLLCIAVCLTVSALLTPRAWRTFLNDNPEIAATIASKDVRGDATTPAEWTDGDIDIGHPTVPADSPFGGELTSDGPTIGMTLDFGGGATNLQSVPIPVQASVQPIQPIQPVKPVQPILRDNPATAAATPETNTPLVVQRENPGDPAVVSANLPNPPALVHTPGPAVALEQTTAPSKDATDLLAKFAKGGGAAVAPYAPLAANRFEPQTARVIGETTEQVLTASNIAEGVRRVSISPPSASDRHFDSNRATLINSAAWPYPIGLASQLQYLKDFPTSAKLAERGLSEVELLSKAATLDSEDCGGIFHRLGNLAEEAWEMSQTAEVNVQKVALQRVAFSISRRLEVWERVHELAVANEPSPQTRGDLQELRDHLIATDHQLSRLQHAEEWRNYLLLDYVEALATGDRNLAVEPGKLMQTVISRIDSSKLSEEQQAFFKQEEFTDLRAELARWTAQPISYTEMLSNLEHYEAIQSMHSGHTLAEAILALRWSQGEKAQSLGQSLESRYRNANVRIAISGDLLNRYVENPEPQSAPVSDTVIGAQVRGHSYATSDLRLQLRPDNQRVHMALVANGEVQARTQTRSKPVTIESESVAQFQAQKVITIERDAVHVWRAQANANSYTHTLGMTTDFDHLPFVGSMVRSVADKERTKRMPLAKDEMNAKTEKRIRDELDQQTFNRITNAESNFREEVLTPLYRLCLDPYVVDLQTTETHIAARYRLGSSQQLSAHTPRPQEPAGSMVNVQFHQSVINNVVERFKLADETFELPELFERFSSKFDRIDVAPPEDLPEDVEITFDKEDPLRVLFEEDQMVVRVRIALLQRGRRKWNNFEVRAIYAPTAKPREIIFTRDEPVELKASEGKLSFRDQIALRGIFNRVFSKSEPLRFTSEEAFKDPGMQDLAINQFVIDDGWIGVALNQITAKQREEMANDNAEENKAEDSENDEQNSKEMASR